jgi:uncharacterized protein YkwD
MLSTRRSLQTRASIFSFALLLLTMVSAAGITSAQAPQGFPVARLLSLPSDSARTSRPRRVLAPAVAAVVAPTLVEATEIERRAFEMTNTARLQNGLAPLSWDPELCRMARIHSENMVRLGFFSHETPSGLQLEDRAHAAGIAHFRVLGENIAYNQGYDDPGAFAVERWLISPGHRANILSSEYEQGAIGSFVTADGTVYLTQEFIKR